VTGWLIAQFPFLIVPDFTIASAAAATPTLRALLTALVCGAGDSVSALLYLYRVFKRLRGIAPVTKRPPGNY
jgi:cytochrome d ubiquinol oxidase subunit II